jgi:hypothetical protein
MAIQVSPAQITIALAVAVSGTAAATVYTIHITTPAPLPPIVCPSQSNAQDKAYQQFLNGPEAPTTGYKTGEFK